MNMENKFRVALLKVLDDGTFKNVRTLALEADVDQGGLSRFLGTMGHGEKEEAPTIKKSNLNLQTVSKLIDVMNGTLIFPWESIEVSDKNKIEHLKEKIEEQERELLELRGAVKNFNSLFLQGVNNDQFDEGKNKSCE